MISPSPNRPCAVRYTDRRATARNRIATSSWIYPAGRRYFPQAIFVTAICVSIRATGQPCWKRCSERAISPARSKNPGTLPSMLRCARIRARISSAAGVASISVRRAPSRRRAITWRSIRTSAPVVGNAQLPVRQGLHPMRCRRRMRCCESSARCCLPFAPRVARSRWFCSMIRRTAPPC